MEPIELGGRRLVQHELQEGGKAGIGATGPTRRAPRAQHGGTALLSGEPLVVSVVAGRWPWPGPIMGVASIVVRVSRRAAPATMAPYRDTAFRDRRRLRSGGPYVRGRASLPYVRTTAGGFPTARGGSSTGRANRPKSVMTAHPDGCQRTRHD
jgi:hypothetical protein